MDIPSESSPVVDSLRATLVACETFRLLVDANDEEEASDFVHDGVVYDTEGAEGDPEDELPRAMLDDSEPEDHQVKSPGNIDGSGRLGIYIQFEQFTDAELADWYSLAPGAATQRDHRKHCRNLYRRITRELGAVLQTPGCLLATSLRPRGWGPEDPKENNDIRIWAMEWDVYWRGTP